MDGHSPFAEHAASTAWPARTELPRHRHETAYAALVLSGGYVEAGSRGRFRVQAGDVLCHGPFDAHLDRFGATGAKILDLPLPSDADDLPALAHVDDVDAIARLAERDPAAGARALCAGLKAIEQSATDWPDLLARALLSDASMRLADWAVAHGLARETVSRGFAKVFGQTPAAFRAEARARRALGDIRRTVSSLADIAAAAGFADQAHMTRAITALTRRPPRHWRRTSHWFVSPR